MNFREIENIENRASLSEATLGSFQQEIIADYLEKEKRKLGAKENPFVYFYEDVIANSLSYNFQIVLGAAYYKNASEDALSCLNICDDFYRLSSWSVSGWLQNALKFIDNIILHYLQETLKEIPIKYDGFGVEKSRYIQLSNKTGDMSTVGHELKELYDLRNDLEHRTIIHADGRQELVPPKRPKVRRTIVKLYPDVLKRVLKTYKNTSNNN